jgi:excisionase family DNA binding protein
MRAMLGVAGMTGVKRRTRRAKSAVPLFIPAELKPCRECGQAKRMPGWKLCRSCWSLRHGPSASRGSAMIEPSPLLDAAAAAELLNVPKSWVLAEARADRIPHIRLGRYVRFDPDRLREWWEAQLRGG